MLLQKLIQDKNGLKLTAPAPAIKNLIVGICANNTAV
jgi:hypothetical protein